MSKKSGRNIVLFLNDIQQAIDKIERYVGSKKRGRLFC